MKAEITKLPNITTDGLLATSGGDGTLGVASGTEGDLLQVNNLGVFEAKSPTLVNKSLTPFLNSPLGGLIDLDNVFAWDSFSRPNALSLGNADSGQAWDDLVGNGFQIITNTARPRTLGNISTIPYSSSVETPVSVFVDYARSVGQNASGAVVFMADLDNYIEIRFDGFKISVFTIIAGVNAQIFNLNYEIGLRFNSRQRRKYSYFINFSYTSNEKTIFIGDNLLVRSVVPITTMDAIWVDKDSLTSIGIASGTGANNLGLSFNNFAIIRDSIL